MIKELISDLAYDKIQLSQALSRSKLLAYKVNNNNFKNWLRKELEGYEFNNQLLPDYRIIYCQMFITHSLPSGKKHSKPVRITDSENNDLYEEVNYYKILSPIAIIEQQVAGLDNIGYIYMSAEEAYNISYGDPYQKWVVGGSRRFGKGQLQNIIELTKQKLLDTLLELDDQFPNLINDFTMTNENKEKVQNIITNNIYGNNNATNIGAGTNIDQAIKSVAISEEDENKLKSYGVTQEEIDDLKKIIANSSKEKSNLLDKTTKWLGSVTASVAGRGFYDNIPAITDFIRNLI